jgi:hypothetical protein
VLLSVKSLNGYRIGTTDGLTGAVVDFYFNDQDWSMRHVVASEHPTRLHKACLLPPNLVAAVDRDENVMHTDLSRAQYQSLAPASSVVPVCRQYMLHSASPGRDSVACDPHIRSAAAVEGYELHDPEMHLGVVHDYLIDPRTWRIEFLVGRRFGVQEREFLVSTSAVSQISFASRRVAIRKAGHWDLVFEERNGYDRMLEAVAA